MLQNFFFRCHIEFVILCRSATSLRRDSALTTSIANSETEIDEYTDSQLLATPKPNFKPRLEADQTQKQGFGFPFGDWLSHPWSKQRGKLESRSYTSDHSECMKQEINPSPLLPKITMVGISTGEAGQMSKATLKKTMEDLTRELEQIDQGNTDDTHTSTNNGFQIEDRDPLFVANVGDFPGVAKTGSARWVRGGGG